MREANTAPLLRQLNPGAGRPAHFYERDAPLGHRSFITDETRLSSIAVEKTAHLIAANYVTLNVWVASAWPGIPIIAAPISSTLLNEYGRRSLRAIGSILLIVWRIPHRLEDTTTGSPLTDAN